MNKVSEGSAKTEQKLKFEYLIMQILTNTGTNVGLDMSNLDLPCPLV